MTGDAVVSIVTIIGALVLALRGMRGRGGSNRWMMAIAWLVIIVGLVFLIQSFGVDLAR